MRHSEDGIELRKAMKGVTDGVKESGQREKSSRTEPWNPGGRSDVSRVRVAYISLRATARSDE